MNKMQESRFAFNPKVDIGRSTFKRDSSVKLSGNVGDLICFFCDEVLPGDTFQIDSSKLIRMQPMVTAPMDNMFADFYWFFVPNRLLWDHWKEFQGENTQSAWIPQTTYQVPQITSPNGGWNNGTIADYMGLPTKVGNISVNALPFRGYARICDEWFRDENLTDPLVINFGDSTSSGSNGSSYKTDVALGGKPFQVAKYHDYFTSALPSAQKGAPVQIPMPTLGGATPVYATGDFVPSYDGAKDSNGNYYGTMFASKIGDSYSTPFYDSVVTGITNAANGDFIGVDKSQSSTPFISNRTGNPVNLWAIGGSSLTNAPTINQLRQAFAIQKAYEKDARGGTRYIEALYARFGVTSPDARQQRSEFLGGNRIPINVNTVLNTAGATASTPQGKVVGQSVTANTNSDFTHSFTEHGYIFGLFVVRYDHSYQQGIERMWSRKDRFDFYEPVFANLGEMCILNKEVYAQGSTVKDSDGVVIDDKAFGYQEAWADYRYKPSRVCGQMRSNDSGTLDAWHFADNYASLPTLSDGWIRETPNNVDRCLTVAHNVADQFWCDIYIQNKTTRPMPMYSIPGLIDHH